MLRALLALWFAVPIPACSPVPGAGALWSKPDLRFIVVGEMHGSVETPALFADLVSAAMSGTRPVVVGLERPVEEQADIDRFLTGTDHAAATHALPRHTTWHMFDGRSSRAMLALLESLRALKADVVSFDDRRPGETPAENEQRLAAVLAAAARRPGALLLALTGNLHGSRKPIAAYGGYPFMAMRLPPDQTLTLFAADRGGESWSQMNGACAPHAFKSTNGVARGVDLTARAPMAGYDGVLSTGLPSTASPPAVDNAPAPPACSDR